MGDRQRAPGEGEPGERAEAVDRRAAAHPRDVPAGALTAKRLCEVRRAIWDKIDLEARTWTIP